MALSDHLDGVGSPHALTFLREPYRTDPALKADPIEWKTYVLPLEVVKEYLKVEHDLEDATIISMAAAAVEMAKIRTNRSFLDVPESVHLAILKTIAFWYENRSELNQLPEEAERIFLSHRRNPGL